MAERTIEQTTRTMPLAPKTIAASANRFEVVEVSQYKKSLEHFSNHFWLKRREAVLISARFLKRINDKEADLIKKFLIPETGFAGLNLNWVFSVEMGKICSSVQVYGPHL